MSKDNMANIVPSPPFMPIGYREREIWAILLDLCPDLDNIKITKYEPCKSITVTGEYFGEPIEKEIDISWAFAEISPGIALDLVKKVYKEINEGKV